MSTVQIIEALAPLRAEYLRPLARAFGIQPHFRDNRGRVKYLKNQTLRDRIFRWLESRYTDSGRAFERLQGEIAALKGKPEPVKYESPTPVPEDDPIRDRKPLDMQEPMQEPKPKPEPEPEPQEKPEKPRKGRAGGVLEEIIRDAVEDAVGEVLDAEEIRRIARDAAAEAAPLRVEIHDGGEVRQVQGLAHKELPRLVQLVGAGLPVWAAGPSGGGKTYAAPQVAEALAIPFRGNMGACLTRYDLLGFVSSTGREVPTPLRTAILDGGLVCLDEVDAYGQEAALALNPVVGGRHAELPGLSDCVAIHPDFRLIATGNTWGHGADSVYIGRNRLDAAFLARFVRVEWGYDTELERAAALAVAEGHDNRDALRRDIGRLVDRVQELRTLAESKGLRVVFSPRQSIYGARCLRAGMALAEAIHTAALAGLSSQDLRTLEVQ